MIGWHLKNPIHYAAVPRSKPRFIDIATILPRTSKELAAWINDENHMCPGDQGLIIGKMFTDPWMVDVYGFHVGKYIIHGSYGVPLIINPINRPYIIMGYLLGISLYPLLMGFNRGCSTARGPLRGPHHFPC